MLTKAFTVECYATLYFRQAKYLLKEAILVNIISLNWLGMHTLKVFIKVSDFGKQIYLNWLNMHTLKGLI